MNENYNSVSFLAPGKIIITGEYSGMFDGKFLSTSVNLYTKCKITKSNSFSVKSKIENKSHNLAKFFKDSILPKISSEIPKISVEFESNIPVSRGVGSSAAFVNSFLINYLEFLEKKEQEKGKIFTKAIEIEDIFHHKSSGTDIYTSLFGGTIISSKNSKIILQNQINFEKENLYIIDTGKKNETSKSVSHVMKNFKENDPIWQDFKEINHSIIEKTQNNENYLELIKENHKLLEKIGIVPEKVAKFILELEKNNCYGKISGSGSIDKNSGGGIVLAFGNFEIINKICEKFNYKIIKTNTENLGTHREIQKISAPGKIILFGEHAVLHDKNAISAAINKRLKIEFSTNWTEKIDIQSENNKLSSNLESFKLKKSDYFYKIFFIIKIFKLKIGINIKISSEIRSGLGSSGAISACILTAILRLKNQSITQDQIFKYSKSIIEKSSSGIDIATSIYGGIILFKKDRKPTQIRHNFRPIYAVYSGMKIDTKKTISVINKNVSRTRQKEIFEKINEIVLSANNAIINSDYNQINSLILKNQEYLKELQLANKDVQNAIDIIEKNNIKRYKISGSGLGDFVITLDEKAEKIGLKLTVSTGISYE